MYHFYKPIKKISNFLLIFVSIVSTHKGFAPASVRFDQMLLERYGEE